MMASDIHHRTEDFRRIYKQALTDLKDVMGYIKTMYFAFAASGKPAQWMRRFRICFRAAIK